jgi:integrase
MDIHRLTQKGIEHAKPPKGRRAIMIPDGGNLYLQATIGGNGGINRSWLFRYELDGARHDMGLGPVTTLRLAEAREQARQLRQQIIAGIDPLGARNEQKAERKAKAQAARAEKAKAQTFRECAEKYLAVHGDKWKNPKHAAQWRATLATYAHPIIGDLNVADIDEAHLVRVLEPIWRKIPETARRVRGRIEAVLGYATVSKFRTGDNPARWHNHLQTLLGGTQKAVEHHAALPFAEVPAFMVELRGRNSTSASALEFAVLTAARTGEVIGALWDEIDLKAKTWTIPKERMKANADYRVPLTPRAVEVLSSLERRGTHVFGTHVFGTPVTGKPLSNMALLELLRGMRAGFTVHGFRSAFRDWAAERTNYPNHVVEKALAHSIPDKVEKAYRRGDLFEKRRRLMLEWEKYLSRPSAEAADVHDLAAVRQRRGR